MALGCCPGGVADLTAKSNKSFGMATPFTVATAVVLVWAWQAKEVAKSATNTTARENSKDFFFIESKDLSDFEDGKGD